MTRGQWFAEFADELLDRLPDAIIRVSNRGSHMCVGAAFAGKLIGVEWPAGEIELGQDYGRPRRDAAEVARLLIRASLEADRADAEDES